MGMFGGGEGNRVKTPTSEVSLHKNLQLGHFDMAVTPGASNIASKGILEKPVC